MPTPPPPGRPPDSGSMRRAERAPVEPDVAFQAGGDTSSPSEAAAPADAFSRDALVAGSVLYSMRRRVRLQEVDAAQTIYFSRIFEYFGDAYVDLVQSEGLNLAAVLKRGEWFSPIVRAEAEYLAPMRFGDTVNVCVVRARCGTSAATIGYRIATEDEHPLAVGYTVHVFVDGTTFRPCPIPAEVRRALLGPAAAG